MNALLLILLLSSTPATPRSPVVEYVELTELNHFFDDLGRHAYDQVIFYEWSPDYQRFDVVAWSLVESIDKVPSYDHHRQQYRVSWYDRDLRRHRIVWSRLYRQTWTDIDPERAAKRLKGEKYRTCLRRIP